MSVAIDVSEAMKTLPKLLRMVQAGEEIVISEHSSPVARIAPLSQARGQRRPGTGIGKFIVHEDFDAPLPQDIMRELDKGLDQ